jgi:hypothetical protein
MSRPIRPCETKRLPWRARFAVVGAASIFFGLTGAVQAQENASEVKALRDLVEQQQKQIGALVQRVNNLTEADRPKGDGAVQRATLVAPVSPIPPMLTFSQQPSPVPPGEATPPTSNPALMPSPPEEKAATRASFHQNVADYLKENPGIGMPPSVQTGFEMGRGFVIRSAPNPLTSPGTISLRSPLNSASEVACNSPTIITTSPTISTT